MKRRDLLAVLPTLTVASAQTVDSTPRLTTNTYPWITFAKRAGEKFENHSNSLMGAISRAGFTGYEPIVSGVQEFEGLDKRLKKHGLRMTSLYVNSSLHETQLIEKSSLKVLEIAREAKKLGTKIIVTNPSPIKWGSDDAKSDAQLQRQAKAMDELGAALKKEGLTLAYHNHDMELKHGAREFHHMLSATSADNVRFCLDSHWIYRGCGDSQVALFDALERYSSRIEELHLRQSSNGVWNEAFALDGDINYRRIFDFLDEKGIRPHLVLEQAVEERSAKTLTTEDAHKKGRLALKKEH